MTKNQMIQEMVQTFEKQLQAFMGKDIRLLIVTNNKVDDSRLTRSEIETMMQRNIELAFGLKTFGITNKTRRRPYPEARFCYFFLHKQYFPKVNLKELAMQMGFMGMSGDGDHTSPIYGKHKHVELYEADQEYKMLANKAIYYIEKALTETPKETTV